MIDVIFGPKSLLKKDLDWQNCLYLSRDDAHFINDVIRFGKIILKTLFTVTMNNKAVGCLPMTHSAC